MIGQTVANMASTVLSASADVPVGTESSTVVWGDMAAKMVLFLAVDVGIVAIAVGIMMCLWRILRGPTLIDRGLASDTLAIQVAGIVILLTIRMQSLLYFDAVLIVSMLGFVSTVAFAQFIGRRRSVL